MHENKIAIPVPSAPTIADPTALTPQEEVDKMIFKGELDAYVKRKNVLDESIMKTYSLVLGQCTDLLQSKLKQQNQWEAISEKQDAIALIGLIKTITFRFEDQKFLPLALYQSKAHLYNLRQDTMTNTEYLQRFQNLVDVATAYAGQLHDQAIVDIVTERLHPSTSYDSLNADEKQVVQTASSELYLATMFLRQSDRRCYGKLSEELENAFTKGNDDYPDNLVSAYHLINEYKCWQPIGAAPEASGVAFAQKHKGKGNKGKSNDDSWEKKAKCHHCGEVGHIRPNCPTIQDDEDNNTSDTEKTDSNIRKSKATNKTEKKKSEKTKTSLAQDANTTDAEESEPENQFFQYDSFGFCSVASPDLKLRNMILLDCQSTVDLFCNRKLVSRVWESAKPMTVHGNGGNLSTNLKAHVTNYGDVWFHPKAITNILSLKNVREKFRVTYESPGGESDFVVHKPNGIDIHFVMHADGLHYHDTNNRHLTMVSTVKDESEGFSARQVAQAKAAPSFQSKVGHPPVEKPRQLVIYRPMSGILEPNILCLSFKAILSSTVL